MKTVLLAGGLGTRLAELTDEIPKPMVEIGAMPILWHIMKCYSRWGFEEFVIALGYKQEVVKGFFLNRHRLSGNLTVDLASGVSRPHQTAALPWIIHLMDTGQRTMTGGRVRRLRDFLGRETFMLTYGDGVSDVNLRELLDFHRLHGRLATVTAVRPPARFGSLTFDGDLVREFSEKKPQMDEGWINGGYMVMEPGVFEYMDGDETSLESDTLERLARDGQLAAYRHHGFWQCMDTLRDVRFLRSLYESGAAPWLRQEDRRNGGSVEQGPGHRGARIHWLDPHAHASREGT